MPIRPPSPHPFARLRLATEGSEYDRPAEQTALATAQRRGLPLQEVPPLRSNPDDELPAPGRPCEAIVRAAERIGADLPMGRTAQRAVGLAQHAVRLVQA